ncbi:hypothetical protein KW795_02700 [Candidatus Microgenomates bacterium]|nr:hypothetical protein [Candidatus Microgenomates bacterium]
MLRIIFKRRLKMCLFVDKSRLKPRKNIVAYKVLSVDSSGDIFTPNERAPVQEGLFKAKGILPRKLNEYTSIGQGAIHVYEKAQCNGINNWLKNGANYFVVEVQINPKDFIAWGHDGDIVAKKITIPVGSLDKYKRQRNVRVLEGQITKVSTYISQVKSALCSAEIELTSLKKSVADLK